MNIFIILQNRGLLHELQLRFRKNYSTETALTRLVDQLSLDLDKNIISGLVFVHFKKAFDSIDHLLFLEKLYMYGIHSKELNLFKEYLSNRLQYVNVEGHCFLLISVNIGVPQGSILGPVFFLLFINDLPSAVYNSTVDIYADDTTLSSSSDVKTFSTNIPNALQKDLDGISRWASHNNMVILLKPQSEFGYLEHDAP